jgi:hypothetical protein
VKIASNDGAFQITGNERVKSSSSDSVAYAKYLYNTYGKTITNWEFYQDTGETDPDKNYYYIKELINVQTYNGGYMKSGNVTHQLPWSDQQIGGVGPEDSGRPKYNVKITYPLSAEFSWEISTEPYINKNRDAGEEKAWWDISGSIGDNEDFIPHTSWSTTGSYTGIDLSHRFLFHVPGTKGDQTSADDTIQPRYYNSN